MGKCQRGGVRERKEHVGGVIIRAASCRAIQSWIDNPWRGESVLRRIRLGAAANVERYQCTSRVGIREAAFGRDQRMGRVVPKKLSGDSTERRQKGEWDAGSTWSCRCVSPEAGEHVIMWVCLSCINTKACGEMPTRVGTTQVLSKRPEHNLDKGTQEKANA